MLVGSLATHRRLQNSKEALFNYTKQLFTVSTNTHIKIKSYACPSPAIPDPREQKNPGYPSFTWSLDRFSHERYCNDGHNTGRHVSQGDGDRSMKETDCMMG